MTINCMMLKLNRYGSHNMDQYTSNTLWKYTIKSLEANTKIKNNQNNSLKTKKVCMKSFGSIFKILMKYLNFTQKQNIMFNF